MAFNIDKALSDGHSASDIVDYLAKDSKFNVELARKDGHSDQDILTHLRPPKKEKESALRQAADVPLNVTKGVVSGVRMLSDAFGADNPISKSLRGVEDYVGDLLSAQAKNDQKEISRIMKEAEDKGVLEQIKAGLNAFTVAPVDLMAQAFGTVIPTLAGGLAGAGLKIGARTVGALTGATMGAGTGKSAIYDAVTEELSKANLPKELIEQAATKAQEYGGKNLDLILANTLLGGIAGTTGIEKALIPGLSKKITEKVAQRGVLTRAAATGLPEAGTEFLQGGTEQASQNIALQREGYDVPTMRGVYSAGTMEGAAGFGMGAAAGALRRQTATPEQPVVEPPVQLAPEPFTPTVQADEQPSTDDLRQQSYERQIALQAESVAKAEQAGNPYVGAVDRFGAPAPVPKDRLGQPIITPPADPFAGYNTQNLRDIVSKEDRLNDPSRPAPPAPAARVPMTEELRIAQQRAVQQQNDEFAAQQELALRQAQNPSLNPEGFGAGRTSVPITPAQAQLRHSGETVTPEQAQRIDRQAKLLGQMDGLPQVEQTGLNAQADIAAKTGKPGGTGQKVPPQTRFVALEAMTPLEARQRLAVLKEDLKTEEMPAELAQFRKQGLQGPIPKNLREPNRSLHVVPHPTVGGRYAIEERVKQPDPEPKQPRRANPNTPSLEQAVGMIREVQNTGVVTPTLAALANRYKLNFILDDYVKRFKQKQIAPDIISQQRQGMADESALNAEMRGGVATQAEADRLNDQGMGKPYDQVEQPGLESREFSLSERERRLNAEDAAARVAADTDPVAIARRRFHKKLQGPELWLEGFDVNPNAEPAPASQEFTDKFLKPEGRKSLQDVVATPEAKAMADEVRKELLPVLKRFGLEKMGLRLVDSIKGGAEGMYFKSVITLALDNKNPMGVMRHEVIHALKELGAFTNGEWKVLTDMAKKQWINQFYSPKLQAEYKAQYDKDGDTTQTFDEYMAEEAIAQAFRFYTETKPPSGMIANLMRRLNNVFAAIREFFMGNGVTDAEQLFLAKSIFSNIESGRMTAGRAGVQPRTAPAYAFKSTPAPKDIPQNLFDLQRKSDRITAMANEEIPSEPNANGIFPRPQDLKREQTLSFRRLNKAVEDHLGVKNNGEPNNPVMKMLTRLSEESTKKGGYSKYSLPEEKNYKLDIDREVRKTARSAVFTEAETKSVEDDAARLNLSPAQTAEILSTIKKQKKQFPATQGWDNLTVIGIDQKLDDLGNPIAGTEFPKYEPITYGYGTPPDKTKAPSKIDQVWMDKVADAFTKQIQAIYRRADKGDKNALSIIAHKSWYKGVAKSLRQDYGAFGDILADLLGATSPNTPVDTNWKFSIDVLKRFARGDFDTEMKAFTQYLDTGGVPFKYPAAQKIRQISGKLYGMNSTNAMLGLADMWRAIVPGQAPKARNFALNLIGQSDMATIDVWAARMLRRVANNVSKDSFKRIPPPAEKGVTGMWNANATKVTGEFGFGAAVMDKVSKDLKAKGIDIAPPDLQAIAWFAEKELWGNKGWTSKVGEGGSFEENIQNSPVERYVAAHSVQEGDTPPSENVVNFAKKVLLNALGRDKSVVTFRSKETKGLYGGTVEASFDTEWVAQQGKFDPAQIVSILASTSKEQNQYDFFVSKVLAPNEDSLNARPGVEIYFKDQKALQDALPLLKKFTSRGQDGFTLAVDPRATDGSDKYIGVRLQYVPEISMRWDNDLRKKFLKPDEISRVLAGKRKILGEIVSEVARQEGVAHAEMLRYDTLVVGKENYNDYIGTRDSAGNQKPRRIWFGGDIRQHVEAAAKRYSDAERADRGAVVGTGDQEQVKLEGKASFRTTEKGARFSRALGSLEPATSLVPDTSLNNTGNLGMMPDASGIEGKPIRLAVGMEDATTSKGYGATHILKRIEKDSSRKPPADSKEVLEDLIRNVEKTAQSFTRLYRDRNNLIAYNPITTESLVLAERSDHYSVITSYRQNNMGKYGNIAWTGKTPTEFKRYLTPEEPQTGIPVKAGPSGVVRQPVPTTFKQRKVMSPEAIQEMADDRAKVKLEGKASLTTPPALLKQTKTDAFKRWFGKSTIVDANGDPKVMYHGTARDITEFRAKQAGAIFVTDKPFFAENFAASGEYYMSREQFNKMSDNEKNVVVKNALKQAKADKNISKAGEVVVKAYLALRGTKNFDNLPTQIEAELNDILLTGLESRGNIMPLYVSAKNPFDFENQKQVEDLLNKMNKNHDTWGKALGDKARRAFYGIGTEGREIARGSWKEIEKPEVQKAIKDIGHDGFYVKEGGVKNLAVYDSSQLKSAIGNTGAFSPESKNIRYSLRAPTTPEFKKFFNGSKVVDKNGDPLLLYHAAPKGFEGDEFKSTNAINNGGNNPSGYYFSPSTDDANGYVKHYTNKTDQYETGAQIIPAYLSIKNPYILAPSRPSKAMVDQYRKELIDANQHMSDSKIAEWSEPKIKQFKENGYINPNALNGNSDAFKRVLVAGGFDGMKDGRHWVAFYPNQIKSVFNEKPERDSPRFSLTNNVPPAVHTKLVPNQSAGQQVTAAATNAIKAVREDGYFTKLRNGIVDDTSSLGNTLANQGMSQFANNKLRADMLKHTQSNSINIMTVGLQSGVPVLNTDGSIIIKRTESNIARSLILADKLDSNAYVKASKLKGGRGFVAEVARALRGADIKEEDAAMNAEGRQKINDADALEMQLDADVKAGTKTAGAIASAKTKIDNLRKEGKELADKNREKQVDDAQIQWAEAQLKNVPELKEIFGIWKDVNDALTDLSEDTGIISKEQAQKYRDKKFYVPLFKAREDLAEAFFHGSSAKSVAKNYKLEGADIDRNIWENIQKQYAMTIAVAYENQTRKTAIEQLQGFGLAKTVDNPNDPNINLRYKEDGKIVHAIAENPNDIVAFQMMNYELNSVMKFISGTTRVLRFGALVNPMFWFKQLIRDPIHASLTNSQIVTPFHSIAGFAQVLSKSASTKILAERGVIGAVDSTVDLNEYIGQLGKEKKTPQMISSALHKLMQIHEASDAATRVAIFESAKKEALKKGMNEEEAINFAVFRARESINFGVRGNSQTLNVLRHSIPFFQAAITSLDTVYRAATGYGLPPAERNKARITFAKRAAVMGLMSTMYAMMYTDDDEYKDLPDYVKDGNWLYPTTSPDGRKTFVKIPVPFEIGFLFKTLPEAGWRWYSGTSTGKEVAKSALDGLIHNLPGGGTIVPQAFKPVLEVVMNHSLFTGNPIEGMSDQGLPVVERGRNASDFAKAASKAGLDNIGLSPAKIDALIKGYFAELGGTFLSVTSDLIGTDKPTKNIEANLVAKSFMTDPKLSKAVSDFYKLEHNAKEMTNMFAKLKKEGLFDTAREYLEDEDKKKQMVAAPVFRKLGEQLGKIRTEIKRTESREGMTADEKQTRINELQKMLSQTAKRGYDIAERAGISR